MAKQGVEKLIVSEFLCELSLESQSNVKKPSTETGRRSSSILSTSSCTLAPAVHVEELRPEAAVKVEVDIVVSDQLERVGVPAAPLRRRSRRTTP